MSISEHNTILKGFYIWYLDELKNRGYCPGNWKWLIPPYNSVCNPAYYQTNKMIEYTLKPAIISPPESINKIILRLTENQNFSLKRAETLKLKRSFTFYN